MSRWAPAAVLAVLVTGQLHDVAADLQQVRPAVRSGLARHPAVLLQTSVAVVPPASVATESHQKAKGGGYVAGGLPPSAEGAAPGEQELRTAFPPIEDAGLLMPFFSVLLGILCLALMAMLNRGQRPVRDHEAIMRTIFEKCDYHGANVVHKYDLVRSIRAYQADNEGFLDLDKALMRIDSSIDLAVSWNNFRALSVPNPNFAGSPRERGMTMPSTLGPTPLDARPVWTDTRFAAPATNARERAGTMPASTLWSPPSVNLFAPPSVQISPRSKPAPPSVQVQIVQAPAFGSNWGLPTSAQVRAPRTRANTAASTAGDDWVQPGAPRWVQPGAPYVPATVQAAIVRAPTNLMADADLTPVMGATRIALKAGECSPVRTLGHEVSRMAPLVPGRPQCQNPDCPKPTWDGEPGFCSIACSRFGS